MDPESGEILASALTTTEEGDASQVGPLLARIQGPIASVIADGAYEVPSRMWWGIGVA